MGRRKTTHITHSQHTYESDGAERENNSGKFFNLLNVNTNSMKSSFLYKQNTRKRVPRYIIYVVSEVFFTICFWAEEEPTKIFLESEKITNS